MTDEEIEDYIPFEGDFKSRVLTPEEAERHRARLLKIIEKRKMREQDIGV